MTKESFLTQLEKKLYQLPEEEIRQHLAYYEELLNDMIEDGMSEEAAVAKLGDINLIAEEILCSQPLPALVKKRLRPRNGWTAAAVILVVLGSPLWLSLLFALIATVAAFVISIAAVILSLFAVAASLAIGGVFSVFRGFTLFAVSGSYAVFCVGVGLLLLGLTCLSILAAKYSAIGLYRGLRWLYRKAKSLLIVKEN